MYHTIYDVLKPCEAIAVLLNLVACKNNNVQ